MVLQSLDQMTQGSLRRQGYRLETTFGWETHNRPMYTHKTVGDKTPGDVMFNARVGNPKKLTRAEAQYIARKGASGFFMWPPSECMEHEFTEFELVSRPGGGLVQKQIGEQTFGCKWCRANSNHGLPGEAETPSAQPTGEHAEESSVTVDSAPPTTVSCTICGEYMKAQSSTGKPRTQAQQLHALKLHTKRHA